MLRRTILGLAAWASATAMAAVDPSTIEKIPDPSQCPGASPARPVSGVVPHVSTLLDDTGASFEVTLFHRDGYAYSPGTLRPMSLCAFTPAGQFIGGSRLKYGSGSRIWFNRSTGSQDVGLAKLFQKKPDELKGQEFQIYIAVDSASKLEYEVSGNHMQVQALARVARDSELILKYPDGGFLDGVNSILYIARPNAEAGNECRVTVRLYDDEGLVLNAYTLPIPPQGVGRVDVGKLAPGMTGALQIVPVDSNKCRNLYASREVTYPSNAIGGKGLFIDVAP